MSSPLGDFLRARRELITPPEVGLPPGTGMRRVPGLRREEVALLAGISAEYYLRLEQGRVDNPSVQVLDALAGALQLDPEGSAYLMALAAPRSRRRPPNRDQKVPPDLELLVQTVNVPTLVFNKYSEVVTANALARNLSPDLVPGVNRLLWLFTDRLATAYHPEWPSYTAAAVAHLRAQIGTDTEDERLHALVGELSLKSDRFRQLWARHDVKAFSRGSVLIRHPQAGDLELLVQKFAVVGSDRLEALMLHPKPGSRSAEGLALLASLVAEQHQ